MDWITKPPAVQAINSQEDLAGADIFSLPVRFNAPASVDDHD